MGRQKKHRESRPKAMTGKRNLPEFEQPPVNEVVFGLQFQPLQKLRAAHLGKYWQRISERYPHTEEQVPVPHLIENPSAALSRPAEVEIEVGFGAVPLVPRCWYLAETKLQLIQVQNDRFLRNW